MELSWINFILIPVISGLIGWFTNWIAVKMLFRPKDKIKILFFNIQGVFPKNQATVAQRIGNMVSSELFSSKDIREKMEHPDNLETIRNAVEKKIDEYLNITFPKNYPLTSIFVGKNRKNKIKDDLIYEVEKVAPEVIEHYVQNIERELNIEEIVRRKVADLPPDKLESLLNSILKKEFRFIEWIGGIIGLVIGILQVVMVYLL
ncbi:MAG: hypothetical protein POELPBGB_02560 [Bacteroidia bacterium]|nr:hypothetical protein [Bacteroidia bacterium]